MAKTFSGQVDAWVRKSRGRSEAVLKTAVQKTIEQAQTPKGEGGRLPVDTGFLRSSLVGSLDGMPSGPSTPADAPGSPEDVDLVIAGAELGDVIFIGWSARYARVQEAQNGFAEAAAQSWPKHVREAAREAKRRLK